MTEKEKSLYEVAYNYKIKAENNLTKCVQLIAKRKGFVNWDEFDCCFATGTQTVVQFNNEFADIDLDIVEMANMTAEEIIERFTPWYSRYTTVSLQLLKELRNEKQ